MPAINFKSWKAEKVESGESTMTIRKQRKTNPIKFLDRLYLYSGMRTKHCRKLGNAICCGVYSIRIEPNGQIKYKNRWLNTLEIVQFVRLDGFDSPVEFFWFFDDQYGLPFDGVVIQWNLIA